MYSAQMGALEAVLAAVARRRRLEGAFRRVLEGAGYQEIAVPLLQPADATADWEAAYRVLDAEGRVMDLRPDVTGPVAHLCAAGDAGGPRPRRLYYQAAIFRRVPGEGPREIAQAGAERIGGAGGPEERVAADLEVLGLAASSLRAAGAERLLLAVGHAGYVHERLLAVAGAPSAAALAALRARDYVGLAAVVGDAAAAELSWRGPAAEALQAAVRGDGPGAGEFRALLRALRTAGLEEAVLVEPGLLLPGSYYTGTVFEILVPSSPRPVGDGGRYDRLLERWGRAEPAVGFALDCDRLIQALDGEAPSERQRRAWAALRGGGV